MDTGEIAIGLVAVLATGGGATLVHGWLKTRGEQGRADRAQDTDADTMLRSELRADRDDWRAQCSTALTKLSAEQDARMAKSEENYRLQSEIREARQEIVRLEEQLFAKDAEIERVSALLVAERARLADLVRRALDVQLAEVRPLPPLPDTEPPGPND